jgi:hypothetical protein
MILSFLDEYPDFEYRVFRKKRLCQLIFFLEVVIILRTVQYGRQIEVFVCDPSFTPLDWSCYSTSRPSLWEGRRPSHSEHVCV